MSPEVSDAVQVVQVDYVGLSERLARLEVFRDEHKKEHDKHVATQAWVYKVALGIASSVVAVGIAIGRLITG